MGFEEMNYPVFDLFQKQWGLVTAGNRDRFNSCTVGWGALGTLWGRNVVTVYLHPARYTCDVLRESDTFTLCFFPGEYRKALGIMGTRSGRNTDKVKESGLTSVAVGDGVGYEEANLTFVCRKLYQHQMAREDMAPDMQAIYENNPKSFPPDEKGAWQPHWLFIGEITEVVDKR